MAALLEQLAPSAVLLDIDGVLIDGENPIPGALPLVRLLKKQDIPFQLVTNTTVKIREDIARAGAALGFPIEPEDIHSPVRAAVALLERWERQAGRPYRVHLMVLEEVAPAFCDFDLDGGEGADAVVVGDLGKGFDYQTLNRVFRLLLKGARLIALQKNRFWRREGEFFLDAGPFVAALEYAAGTTAEVVGKPSAGFFSAALEALDADPGETLMIGDDLESDIGGAQALGVKGILVRTGKYRPDTLQKSGVQPHLIIDSVADLLE